MRQTSRRAAIEEHAYTHTHIHACIRADHLAWKTEQARRAKQVVEQLEERVDRIQQLKTNVQRLHQKQTDVREKSTLVEQSYAHHDTSAEFDPDLTFADGRVHRIAGKKIQILGEMPAHGQNMAGDDHGGETAHQDGGKNKAQSGVAKKAWYSRPITPGTLRGIVRDQIVLMVAPVFGAGKKPQLQQQQQQQANTRAQGQDASGTGGVSSVDSSLLVTDENIGQIEKYVEQHLMDRKQAWLDRGGNHAGDLDADKNSSVEQNVMSVVASMRPSMGALKSQLGHGDHQSDGVATRGQTLDIDDTNRNGGPQGHNSNPGGLNGEYDDAHKVAEQLKSSKHVDRATHEIISIEVTVARSCLLLCGGFSRTNPLRLACFYMYTSQLWSTFFTSVALAYSLYLLVLPELPPDVYSPLSASQITGPRMFLWVDIFDVVSAFVLLLETFVGVVALGFIVGQNTYMRISGFHIFDVLVLIVTLWDYIATYALGVRGASLRAFRMLRVFRVLVKIQPLGSMKRIMRAMQFGMCAVFFFYVCPGIMPAPRFGVYVCMLMRMCILCVLLRFVWCACMLVYAYISFFCMCELGSEHGEDHVCAAIAHVPMYARCNCACAYVCALQLRMCLCMCAVWLLMCLRMRVWFIFVHLYKYIHTFMQTRGAVPRFVHTYMCEFVCIYICICNMHVWMHTFAMCAACICVSPLLFVYMGLHTNACVHVCMHMHTLPDISLSHTHTHMYSLLSFLG